MLFGIITRLLSMVLSTVCIISICTTVPFSPPISIKSPVLKRFVIRRIIPPAILLKESLSARATATAAAESAANKPAIEIPSAVTAESITIMCKTILTVLLKNFWREMSISSFKNAFSIILITSRII